MSNKIKLGTAVAMIAAGATATLYYFWKKEEAQKNSSQDQSIANNSSVMAELNQKSEGPKPEATTTKTESVTEPKTETVAETLKDGINNALSGKTQGYNAILEKVKFRVNQERSQQYLSMQLIILLHDALVEFSYKRFGELVTTNRTERRQFAKTDLLTYEAIVRQGTDELEQMVQGDVMQVLIDCGVTQEKYESSNNYWAQINPQFALISLLVIDKMKLMIPSVKGPQDVDMAKVLKIIDFQLEKYPTVKVECSHPELTPMVKQSLLSDMVFDEFDLEEEDYIKVPGLENNREFAQKAQQLQMMIQMESMQGGMMPGMGF